MFKTSADKSTQLAKLLPLHNLLTIKLLTPPQLYKKHVQVWLISQPSNVIVANNITFCHHL